jgi:hypothetical protein
MFAVGAEIVNKNRVKVMKYSADTFGPIFSKLRFSPLQRATGQRILNIYALRVSLPFFPLGGL